MVSYALHWLSTGGIRDIILVTPNDYLKSFCQQHYPHIEVVVPEAFSGTADALRCVRERIKRDFVVVSCDTVTSLQPHVFLDFHRGKNASCTCLMFDTRILFEESKPAADEDDVLLLTDPSNHGLLYLKQVDDLSDEFHIPYELMMRYPRVRISRNHHDAHIYVFKKWIVDWLEKRKDITNIRTDMIPQLALLQHADEAKRTAEGVAKEEIKCYVYQQKSGLCGRANTIPSFLELNRRLIRLTASGQPLLSDDTADGKEHSHPTPSGPDALIADGPGAVGEKSSVKRTAVGKGSTIGKSCRIVNCVIMDHCEVKDGCKLENTILSNRAKVGDKAQLKDCTVAAGFVVKPKANSKGEQFVEMSDLFAAK